MSDSLQITTGLNQDIWQIQATVSVPTVLPAEIFIYRNLGTSTLGDYIGVCNLDELTRLQKWSGSAIPVFGNAFVRHSQAKIMLPLSDAAAVTRATNNLIQNTKTLKAQLTAAADSTTIVTI